MAAHHPRAAILVIGDEILKGETQDTNSAFLCRELTARGVSVERIVTVPDELETIVAALKSLLDYDCVFTSGGIGPTPDDMTRKAVAIALDQQLLLSQTAVNHYEKLKGGPLSEAQLQMCLLPEEAQPIISDTVGAPGFRVGNIYVLPGVPSILEEMWRHIAEGFRGEAEHVESFIADRRESEFADLMRQMAKDYPELRFGSYPRLVDGRGWEVTIRVRGRNVELVQKAAREFMQRMAEQPG